MTTRKPLIALTPNYNIEKEEPYMRPAYIRAIQHAGGIPVTLPLNNTPEDLEQLVRELDGFLFTGGPDVHPFYFGEQTLDRCGNVSPRRDTLELALLKLVMKAKKPVLGICRGIQLLNIGLGGDIYQDLSSQFPQKFPVAHSQPFYYDLPSHTVEVVPGTLLERIVREAGQGKGVEDTYESAPEIAGLNSINPASIGLASTGMTAASQDGSGMAPAGSVSAGTAPAGSLSPDMAPARAGSADTAPVSPTVIQVNSMHHQAVRKLAPGTIASGYAPEGVVEALEMPEYPGFFLAVQWHPEYLWEQDPVAAGIFRMFVEAS